MNRDRPRGTERSPGTSEYTLDELCALAGVTVRTVRYYISEGLLPPPVGGGPNARYTGEHLDRLLVIGMLKERYLPLREIRRTLEGMSGAEIGATAADLRDAGPQPGVEGPSVAMSQSMPAPVPTRGTAESSASDYIAGVLDGREHATRTRRPAPPPETRSWKRVTISDEAELLVDEAAWHRRREQIEALVAWARRILNGS